MAPGPSVPPEDLLDDLPQVRHILVRGRVEGVRQDRLVGTAGQPEGGLERRVHPQRPVAVRNRFGPGQQTDEDHLDLLDRAVLDHLLLESEAFFERTEEPDLPQVAAEQAEARMSAVVPLALARSSTTLFHGTPPGSDCLGPFRLPEVLPSDYPVTGSESVPALFGPNLGSCARVEPLGR